MKGTKLIGSELIDGDRCYILEVRSQSTINRFWINPQKGYRPQKRELRALKNRKSTARVITRINLEPHSEGIWFPTDVTQTIEDLDEKSGAYRLKVTHQLYVYNFLPNPPPLDDVFTFQFPDGVSVFDTRSQTEYRVKSAPAEKFDVRSLFK